MTEKKYCIFHVPNHIDENAKSGSHVRPRKMLEAFERIGYEVDAVMGYGKERKKQIENIKKKVKGGWKYEFLYSESSTMPTLLTEKDHIPRYPNLDFGFFKFCKAHGIRIGLFYRDIHWKFEKYRKEVSKVKQIVSIPLYRYDLRKYGQLVDILYLPSLRMEKQISEYQFLDIRKLPPGAAKSDEIIEKRRQYFQNREQGKLKLFYVGGIRGIYDLSELLKTIASKEYINCTICCRDFEWEQEKEKYAPYMTERVRVVHVSGKELEKYYLEADICSCCFALTEYMSFAVPIKLLEYTSNVTPVIVTKGTEAGDFVEKFQNGFCINYKRKELDALFEYIYQNQEILLEKHEKALKALENNTWEKRAEQIQNELKEKR